MYSLFTLQYKTLYTPRNGRSISASNNIFSIKKVLNFSTHLYQFLLCLIFLRLWNFFWNQFFQYSIFIFIIVICYCLTVHHECTVAVTIHRIFLVVKYSHLHFLRLITIWSVMTLEMVVVLVEIGEYQRTLER